MSRLIRSSLIARRNACTSNAGIITIASPDSQVGSNWLLQPVTWNNGTETKLRTLPSVGSLTTRRQVSMFDRNLRASSSRPLETRSFRWCRRSRRHRLW